MIDSRKKRGPRFREWLAASVLAASTGACSAHEAPVTEPAHPSMPAPPKVAATPPPPKIVITPPPSHRPEFGEYVYVEELPEAVKKVDPMVPDDQDRVRAVVIVQALVLEDGSVGDARVVESVPILDEAAVACVRQWRFKPATSGGKPVAVWVAIPIRFGPH